MIGIEKKMSYEKNEKYFTEKLPNLLVALLPALSFVVCPEAALERRKGDNGMRTNLKLN